VNGYDPIPYAYRRPTLAWKGGDSVGKCKFIRFNRDYSVFSAKPILEQLFPPSILVQAAVVSSMSAGIILAASRKTVDLKICSFVIF
jgi:hypothetical protein